MQVTGTAPPRDIDLKRTRAIPLRRDGAPLSIKAEDTNDWSYEVTLDAAVELMTRAELTNASSQITVWSDTPLADVPTTGTDWIGRIVRGSFLAFVIYASFICSWIIAIGLMLIVGVRTPILVTAISSALFAAVAWLVSARWAPGVNLERFLTALSFLPTLFILLFNNAAAEQLVQNYYWMLASLLYGVYFMVKRDQIKYGGY